MKDFDESVEGQQQSHVQEGEDDEIFESPTLADLALSQFSQQNITSNAHHGPLMSVTARCGLPKSSFGSTKKVEHKNYREVEKSDETVSKT